MAKVWNVVEGGVTQLLLQQSKKFYSFTCVKLEFVFNVITRFAVVYICDIGVFADTFNLICITLNKVKAGSYVIVSFFVDYEYIPIY